MRALAAKVFLIAFVLKGNIDHLSDTQALGWFRETSQRMAMLKEVASRSKALGASGEEVGYLNTEQSGGGAEYLFGLQCEMLPSILVDPEAQQFVVAHVHGPEQLPMLERTRGLQVVGSAGHDFYVLRRGAH